MILKGHETVDEVMEISDRAVEASTYFLLPETPSENLQSN